MRLNIAPPVAASVLVLVATCGLVWLEAAPQQRTIGAVAATPAYIVINTPTQVRFTAVIADPTVQPGVNVLRVDATGKTLATVGTMNDSGTGGDQMAGDKVFSLRVNLNQATVGQVFYRVSAPFKGVLQRALSSLITVHVDPFTLPADPGPAGQLTVAGIDADGDGVRDDVQRWIALSAPSDAPLRNGLSQLARSYQGFILNADSSQNIVVQFAKQRTDALHCLYFLKNGNIDAANDLRVALRAAFLDTPARSRAYINADAKLSGTFSSGVDASQWKDGCK